MGTIQAMYKGLWDFGMQAEAAAMGIEVPCFQLQNCLSDPMSDCLKLIKQCGEQKMLEGLIKKFLARNPEFYGNLEFGDVGMLLAQVDKVTDDDKEFYDRFVRRFVALLEKKNPEWELTEMDKEGLRGMAGMLLMEIQEWENNGDKWNDEPKDDMSIASLVSDLVEDPVGFLEDMAEMDMEELMKMMRRVLGPIMGEEMMMEVEMVMRSMDWEGIRDLLNGLTAVFNGDISFDELLRGIMDETSTEQVGEILQMVGIIDENMMPLVNGFLNVGEKILMDAERFLEMLANNPDDVAEGITDEFSEWFEMNGIERDDALEIVLGSPLFSFDVASFNAILASDNPSFMYGAIAMISETIFETISYIEDFVGQGLLPAEMWAEIKAMVENTANGILWSFINLPEDAVVFGVIETLVVAVNDVLDKFVDFRPYDLACLIRNMRNDVQALYEMIRPFILPRVADAIDVAMDGHDTISGLLHVGFDQVNHLGNMTDFFIDFDEIAAMFNDTPGIKSWIDAVLNGFLARPDNEYWNSTMSGNHTIENDTPLY